MLIRTVCAQTLFNHTLQIQALQNFDCFLNSLLRLQTHDTQREIITYKTIANMTCLTKWSVSKLKKTILDTG